MKNFGTSDTVKHVKSNTSLVAHHSLKFAIKCLSFASISLLENQLLRNSKLNM